MFPENDYSSSRERLPILPKQAYKSMNYLCILTCISRFVMFLRQINELSMYPGSVFPDLLCYQFPQFIILQWIIHVSWICVFPICYVISFLNLHFSSSICCPCIMICVPWDKSINLPIQTYKFVELHMYPINRFTIIYNFSRSTIHVSLELLLFLPLPMFSENDPGYVFLLCYQFP